MNFPLPELPYLKQLDICETENGQNTQEKKIFSLHTPILFAYLFQSIQLIAVVIFSGRRYDIVIAEDPLLAFLSVILRLFGKCKKIIFYSHGVDKNRFSFLPLNLLYRYLDKFAANNSDFNWFLNKNFYEIREKQGISRNRLFWIPASVPIKSLARKANVFNHKIVFLGVVNEKNGAHIFVNIINRIKKKIPDIQLDIIGNGNYLNTLKKEIAQNQLENNITLLGLKEFKDFAKILTNYTVGIAPYEDKFDTLTATSDSMKMRVYLAAGLPVVITDGFVFSQEIRNHNIGFTPAFNAEEIAKAILRILTDKNLSGKLRKKALEYSEDTDVHTIYNKTFSSIL